MMTLDGIKAPHFGMRYTLRTTTKYSTYIYVLGFHFEVTLRSAMSIGKQARGTFTIKFNDQDEEKTLFE